MSPHAPSSFDDALLEEKMRAEVRWTFTDVGLELIDVLELQWQRVMPGLDQLPHGLRFYDEHSPGVMFTTKCLVRSGTELLVMRDAYLYTEAGLAEAGNGPRATSDCFNDLSVESIDLDAALPADVRTALLAVVGPGTSDTLGKLLEAYADPDSFIASITDADVRELVRKYREGLKLSGE